jgi:hypothetical protein
LKSLGYEDIVGYDVRKDRREESIKKYGIEVVDDLKKLDLSSIDAIIVSTPPDRHNEYIKLAIDNKIPAFVEASVILEGLEELNELAKKNNVFIAPSCTIKFHPAIKEIKNIVQSGIYGKVTNPKNFNIPDLNLRELAYLVPLLVFIFWVGLYPNFFLNKMHKSVDHFIGQVQVVDKHHLVQVDSEYAALDSIKDIIELRSK